MWYRLSRKSSNAKAAAFDSARNTRPSLAAGFRFCTIQSKS
jgi:hypothetical protein